MDHLLAADVLLGDQAAVPTSSSTYTHLANNVFYLAGRIVDNLWQGQSQSLSVCLCLSVCLFVSLSVCDCHTLFRMQLIGIMT